MAEHRGQHLLSRLRHTRTLRHSGIRLRLVSILPGRIPCPAGWRLVGHARYGLKQGSWWTGYKIHISESCDGPDNQDPAVGCQALIPGADGPPPRLIISIATTDAPVTDAEMTDPVHHMLAARDLLPAEHFLDSGYASAELIVGMKKNFGVTLVTPVLMTNSPQARAVAGRGSGRRFRAGALVAYRTGAACLLRATIADHPRRASPTAAVRPRTHPHG
ncbi:hypothetical protein ACF1BE_26445 [Streptomyces sp. NPDC014991]|uniref:hypothetical protein n=1 Tax=Streptomyces sp. NPDC014991 TaxID=3364935 RepID=UPI0036FCAD70